MPGPMQFDRGWDFNQGNRVITFNDLTQDPEVVELLGTASSGGNLDELTGSAVDSPAEYRLLLFSNGTVKAIPTSALDPVPPTGLAVLARLSSAKLTWTAATAPLSGRTYAIYRNGAQIATTTSVSYTDRGVSPGSTYIYQVLTVDTYGQRSALTTAVTAFIDPSLNVPPVVTVTAWPPAAPTNGKTYLRVCATDADSQTLTLALGVDSGSIVSTDDPSIWIYTP